MFMNLRDRLLDFVDDVRFGNARTRVRALLPLVLVLTLLAGGGSFGLSYLTKKDTPGEYTGKVVLWHTNATKEASSFQKWAKKTYPNMNVKVVAFASDAELVKQAKIRKVELPDLVIGHPRTAIELNNAKSLRPVTYTAALGAAVDPTMIPELSDGTKATTVIPFAYVNPVAVHNTDLVRNQPPTLAAMAETKAVGNNPVICFENVGFSSQELISSLGGKAWDDAQDYPDRSGLTDAGFLAKLESFVGAVDGISTSCDREFEKGKIPYAFLDPTRLNEMGKTPFKVFALPNVNEKEPARAWTQYLVVGSTNFNKGSNIEAVNGMRDWFMTEQGQFTLATASHRAPILNTARERFTEGAMKVVGDLAPLGAIAYDRLTQVDAGGGNYFTAVGTMMSDIAAGRDATDSARKAAAVIARNYKSLNKPEANASTSTGGTGTDSTPPGTPRANSTATTPPTTPPATPAPRG